MAHPDINQRLRPAVIDNGSHTVFRIGGVAAVGIAPGIPHAIKGIGALIEQESESVVGNRLIRPVTNDQAVFFEAADHQIALVQEHIHGPFHLFIVQDAGAEGKAVSVTGEKRRGMFGGDTVQEVIAVIDTVPLHDGFLQDR